ncbi:MAG: hypothetical protein KGO92_11100 [Bacteroidota bacterium]|nr:hypothetical protein [Bacteroidota bacterium]
MKSLLIITAFCLSYQGMAQNASTDGVASMMQLYDSNGNPLLGAKRNHFINSPYLNDNWGRGEVVFINGKKLKDAVLRFDLNDQKLHYQIGDIEFTFLDPISAFSYTYSDDDKTYSVHFRNGYPGKNPEDKFRYYEILAENDRYELLKFISKKVEDYYEYNGPTSKYYKLFTSLHLYDKLEMILAPAREKQVVEKMIPSLKEKLNLLTNKGRNIPEKDWIHWFANL